MSSPAALVVAGCLVLTALVVGWPLRRLRARRRGVLVALTGGGVAAGAESGTGTARSRRVRLLPPGGRRLQLGVAAAVVVAGLLGGTVAGVAAGAYGTVAARAITRHRAERTAAEHRAELQDALGAAAADLRAGLPAATALPAVPGAAATVAPWSRVGAAARLAEQTGAPLADVIERIEADSRSAQRARSAAAAQVAGARATAWLLAALPAAGLALGYAIGTDPLAVLLHTPLGAVSAVAAIGLQLAGLAWAGRITRPPAVAS